MFKDALKALLNKNPQEAMAAVLVPIIDDRDPRIVMIKRGENLTRSAGHVAFPGGMIEKGEEPKDAALREFEEELGISKDDVEVLGYLDRKEVMEYRIPICPVVGIISSCDFKPDKREVSRILVDSLKKVLMSRRVADWGANFECDGELVWGASSRVLDDLYLRIVKNYGSIVEFFRRVSYA